MQVSILITCYNNEKYIRDAINSVLMQLGDFSLEVLVGDDGSNDGTREIIEEFRKSYPNIVKLYVSDRGNNIKSGVRAARNRIALLKYATGDYIGYLDGDDKYTCITKLQEQVCILERKENLGCSCCGHDITVNLISKSEKYNIIGGGLSEGIIDCRNYWKELYFHTNTILFRGTVKQYLLESKFTDFFNDNFITFLLLQKGNIYYIPKSMAQYNITGDGIWTGKNQIYGTIRNLLAYDAELIINARFKKQSFRRHLSDFLFLFNNRKNINKVEIEGLIPYIRFDCAPNTYLLVCYSELTGIKKIRRLLLIIQIEIVNMLNHLSRIKIYSKRILKKCF